LGEDGTQGGTGRADRP